jgi:hypothetical protein
MRIHSHGPVVFPLRGVLALAVSMLCPLSTSAAPILVGDSVQATLTTSGTLVTPFTSPAVVGDGVEFTGAIRTPGKVSYLFDVVVDIGASGFSIGWTSPNPYAFLGGTTLGLSLSGLNFTQAATITGVTRTGYTCMPPNSFVCDGAGPAGPTLSFTGDSINLAFSLLRHGETYTFDLATTEPVATPVPEPTSLALLGTGFATFIVGRYRRRAAVCN